MKIRMTLPLLVSLALLTAAFSTGSPVFLTGALLVLLLCGSSVLGVHLVLRSLTVSAGLTDHVVTRGEDVELQVHIAHRGLIPVAPLQLEIAAGPDRPEQTLNLPIRPGKPVSIALPFHAAHVGVSSPGVKCVHIADLFGICTAAVLPETMGGNLIVLPVPFDVGDLVYSAGESGSESMARAAEDITSPSDLRSYQQGDEMKKIHWKLSARKQELLVRRFESPVMPDALVLMDCSAPPRQADAESQLDVRDALLETAASIMQQSTVTGHPARLPIHGEHPMELDKGMGMPMILEALARVDFSAADRFERVLQLELRRMRKVGSTVVISARLNSRMVDAMLSMRRMGPCVRLYLVTFTPEAEDMLPMISRLQSMGVEVCYVTPMPM